MLRVIRIFILKTHTSILLNIIKNNTKVKFQHIQLWQTNFLYTLTNKR